LVGGDEAGDDGLLRVAAVAVGNDVPGVPVGQDRDGFQEFRAAKSTSAPDGGPSGWGFRTPEKAKIRRRSVLTGKAYEFGVTRPRRRRHRHRGLERRVLAPELVELAVVPIRSGRLGEPVAWLRHDRSKSSVALGRYYRLTDHENEHH
jgi:hypothetical protein